MNDILLASQSPRRKELLEQIGIKFDVHSVDIDETPLTNEKPIELVTRLAKQKALAAYKLYAQGRTVLGSDTIVVSPKGEIFGKPEDKQDAIRMLKQLSANTHQVVTAVAAINEHVAEHVVVSTEVSFCQLDDNDIDKYWQTGEPVDKAGAYGIQGYAGQFVTLLKGSYSSVVGLPLYETKNLLNKVAKT